MQKIHTIVIIGAGPTGLMAAEVLAKAGHRVNIFDAMAKPGRKFLVAGKGGLNLTRKEPLTDFVRHYGDNSDFFTKIIAEFSPDKLRDWVKSKGFTTFVGSSLKVFPKDCSALQLLNKWLDELKQLGVVIHTNHRFLGLGQARHLRIVNSAGQETAVSYDAALLALGGASWPQTGSDGAWAAMLAASGISIKHFRPANCGFEIQWSPFFQEHFSGSIIKNLLLTTEKGSQAQGDLVLTAYGIEGSPVYYLSAELRDLIEKQGCATLFLDLKKDMNELTIRQRLTKPRGKNTMANHLRKTLNLSSQHCSLLKEGAPGMEFSNFDLLAQLIKKIPLRLTATRPLAEAISTAGGVSMNEINNNLMLIKLPGIFVAGEMLDWEAPTGGYLLQAAFSTGVAAARGIMHWLSQTDRR